MYHVLEASDNAAARSLMTQQSQTEERNHQTANNQANAIDGIGYSNRLQTTKDRIAATDNTDNNTQNSNCAEFAQIEDAGNIKDIFKNNRTGIQDNRQVQNGVHNDNNQREHGSGLSAKTCFHQLRHGCRTHFQIGRQEEICQCKQSKQRTNFPANRAHIRAPALTIGANQLFCGQIRQKQRTCDNNTRQAAACEEITFCGIQIISPCLPRGYNSNQCGEEQEANRYPAK